MGTYNAKVYRTQGGNELVAANGGTITVESGGTLDVQAGATVNLPAGLTPTDLTLATGSMLVGDANSYASAVSFKTSGRIPIGSGTTVASVAVSGDATLLADGALTVSKIGGDASAGQIPVGNGTAMVSVAVGGDAALASNGALTVSKIGGDASSGYIPVGNGSAMVNVAVSGAATLAANGALSIAGNAGPPTKWSPTGMKAATFDGVNGAATNSCTLTGAIVGERVLVLFRNDNSGAIATSASFESSISGNDAIIQTDNSDLSAQRFTVILIPASA